MVVVFRERRLYGSKEEKIFSCIWDEFVKHIRQYTVPSRDRDLRMRAMDKATELGLQNFN